MNNNKIDYTKQIIHAEKDVNYFFTIRLKDKKDNVPYITSKSFNFNKALEAAEMLSHETGETVYVMAPVVKITPETTLHIQPYVAISDVDMPFSLEKTVNLPDDDVDIPDNVGYKEV